MCTIRSSLFVLGAFGFVFGIVMTIYGFIMKNFWLDTENSGCQLCDEQNKKIKISFDTCRIAGPICFGLGIIMVVVGLRIRVRDHNDKADQRTVVVFECDSIPTSSNAQSNSESQFNGDTDFNERTDVFQFPSNTSYRFLQDHQQTQFQYNLDYYHSAFTDSSISLENADYAPPPYSPPH